MSPLFTHVRQSVRHADFPDHTALSTAGVLADLVTIEVPIDTRWTSALRLALQEGRPVVAEIRVFPNEPNRKEAGLWSYDVIGASAKVPRGGVTTGLLRTVKVYAYSKHAQQVLGARMKRLAEYLEQAPAAAVSPFYRELGRASLAAPPARHRGRPDRFYARLAAQYVRACERRSRRPVAELTERYPKLTHPQMRDALHEARERGLLTPGDPGKGGGALTPLALTMLGRRPKARPRRRAR